MPGINWRQYRRDTFWVMLIAAVIGAWVGGASIEALPLVLVLGAALAGLRLGMQSLIDRFLGRHWDGN